ncbi:MAG: PAS domain S-box protein, partial [Calditrichia bacterium]
MSEKQLNKSQLKKMYRQLQNELKDEQQKRLMSEKLFFNSKNFFLEAINALDDPVFVKDEQHHWVYLNDALCENMGYPREELIGKSDYDFFPREQADVFWEKDDLVLQTGEPNLNEEEITFHGQTRIIATKKARFIDSQTGKRYIIGTIRDITKQRRATEELARYRNNLENLVKGRTRELTLTNKTLREEVTQRKRAEQLLKLEKEKYYYYINNAPDAVYIIDSAGRLQEINKAACDVTGYSEKELLNLSFSDLAAPEDKHISEKLFRQLREGKNIQSELLFQKKSGEKYYSFVDAVKISIDRIITFCKDTTDRRRAEEAVRESEERYRAVVQQSSDCIFLVDLETKKIEEFNPPLERLLGYTREEFQKLTIYDFINHSKKDINEKIEYIKKYSGLILGERQYIRKDRSIADVDVSVSLIVYGGKEVMCVVARDIT